MIISSKQVQTVLKIYGQQLEGKKNPVSKENKQTSSYSQPDRVDFSPQAKEILAALNSASASEQDVRMERVNELRQKIQSGRYSVEPEAVVEKMIQRIITDLTV